MTDCGCEKARRDLEDWPGNPGQFRTQVATVGGLGGPSRPPMFLGGRSRTKERHPHDEGPALPDPGGLRAHDTAV